MNHSIHDVKDPEAFVRSTILKRRGKPLTPDEMEELTAAGLLELVKLAGRYQPGFNGADPAGSKFSGYAAQFLPRKLDTAWHRLRGDKLATSTDGSRRWEYAAPAVSLDALTEQHPDAADSVHALHSHDDYDSDVAGRLRAALDEQWEGEREHTIRFGVLLSMGVKPGDAQRQLGLTGRDCLAAIARIQRVAHRMGALEAA